MAVQAYLSNLSKTDTTYTEPNSGMWPFQGNFFPSINTIEEGIAALEEALQFRRSARTGENPSYNPVRCFRMCMDILKQCTDIYRAQTDSLTDTERSQMLRLICETYFSGQWCSYEDTWTNLDSNQYPGDETSKAFEVPLNEEDKRFLQNEMLKNNLNQSNPVLACVGQLEATYPILNLAENTVLQGLPENERRTLFGSEYGEYCRLRGVALLRISERIQEFDPESVKARANQESAFTWTSAALEIWSEQTENQQLFKRIVMNFIDACMVTKQFTKGIEVAEKVLNSIDNQDTPSDLSTRHPDMVGYTYCQYIDIIASALRAPALQNSKVNLDESSLREKATNAWGRAVELLKGAGIAPTTLKQDVNPTLSNLKAVGLETRSFEEIFMEG